MEFHLKALKGIFKAKLLAPVPLVLCHRVNYECNLRCIFCPFWRGKQKRKVLSKDRIADTISQAANMGAVMYNVWGTEPLLRQDLPSFLSTAKDNSMKVSLITNGLLLKNRLDEISEHLDYLVVSLDGMRKTYRRIRGVDAFDQVVSGINDAVSIGIKTGINCVICQYNLAEVEKLVELSKDIGVAITFEPVHPLEGVRGYEEYAVEGRKEYKSVVNKIILLKKRGFKVANSYPYLRLMKNFNTINNDYRCRVGRFLMLLEPDGRVNLPCSKFGCVGSILTMNLREIWNSPFADGNRERSSECSQCLFSGFVEASLLYDFKPSAMLNFFSAIP